MHSLCPSTPPRHRHSSRVPSSFQSSIMAVSGPNVRGGLSLGAGTPTGFIGEAAHLWGGASPVTQEPIRANRANTLGRPGWRPSFLSPVMASQGLVPHSSKPCHPKTGRPGMAEQAGRDSRLRQGQGGALPGCRGCTQEGVSGWRASALHCLSFPQGLRLP